MIVPATPALMAAMIADRAMRTPRRRALGLHTGNGGGGGHGHDGQVAATVLGNILRGMDKEQCYAEWLKVAIPADPADRSSARTSSATTATSSVARWPRRRGSAPPSVPGCRDDGLGHAGHACACPARPGAQAGGTAMTGVQPDGAALLDELHRAFSHYVVFPAPEAADGVVLWTRPPTRRLPGSTPPGCT